MPDQLLVCRIGEYEPVFGAVKQSREARRLSKHLAEADKLVAAVKVAHRSRSFASSIWPF